MPRQPINYANNCFYKIVCKNLDIHDIYVGHTTDFTSRKTHHKNNCNNPNNKSYNQNVYRFIRDNGGWDNFDMILIERTKCEDKLDAERKERKYIEDLHATLNMVLPTGIPKNMGVAKYKQDWQIENKQRLAERKQNLDIESKQRIAQGKHDWYIENKHRICAIVKCECGSTCIKHNITRHFESKKHQQFLKNLKEI